MSSNYEAMRQMLPAYYENSPEMQAILTVQGKRLDELFADIEDVRAQRRIDTATWSLPRWEKIWGLTPYATDTIEDRRSRVKAKMRAVSPFTPFDFRNMLLTFARNAEVKEDAVNLHVQFVLDGVTLTNLDIALDMIELYLPANLTYDMHIQATSDMVVETQVEHHEFEYRMCGTFVAGVGL